MTPLTPRRFSGLLGTARFATTTLFRSVAISLFAVVAVASFAPTSAHAATGDTRVAKWKDDRTAAFLLMFDDGWVGQVEVAIPELQKRGLLATFYMVPEKGEYKAYAAKWAEAIKGGGVVYGNHTLTHNGIKDLEDGRKQLGEAARIIREQMQPIAGKPDRLLSFAQPGGVKSWNITKDQINALFKEYHLVDRPPFAGHGAVYHWKTLEEMTALAEKAIAAKGMEYLVVHGVERPNTKWQDFWPLPQAVFFPLLDYLKEKQDKRILWVTDHISQHQYETERNAATVKTLKVLGNGIQIELKSTADAKLYDLPLTLVTEVPATWKECNISQGETKTRATAVNGTLMFDAVPNAPAISIWPAQ